MNRDIFIRNLTRDTIEMSPRGRSANELTPEEFEKVYESFFDMIFGIAAADISSLPGFGGFDGKHMLWYDRFNRMGKLIFSEEFHVRQP